MKKLIIAAVLLIFFTGCDAFLEKQWVDKNVMDLTAQFGTPDQIELNGLVDKIYIYYDLADNTPRDTNAEQSAEPAQAKKDVKTTLFWIDRKGKITKVRQKTISLDKQAVN